MTVQVKDMVLEKVAIGPVSARVYQGAEFGKGAPIVLFFHGGAFLDRDRPASRQVRLLRAWRKPVRSLRSLTTTRRSATSFQSRWKSATPFFPILPTSAPPALAIAISLLLIAGEEAGGNIAAGVALKARDHYADALDGQILISPLLDPFMGTVLHPQG